MTKKDAEIGKEFYEMLKRNGYPCSLEDYGGRNNEDEEFDENDSFSINILNDDNSTCFSIDFHSDGSFYRISGFSSGFWQDELDWKKYGF